MVSSSLLVKNARKLEFRWSSKSGTIFRLTLNHFLSFASCSIAIPSSSVCLRSAAIGLWSPRVRLPRFVFPFLPPVWSRFARFGGRLHSILDLPAVVIISSRRLGAARRLDLVSRRGTTTCVRGTEGRITSSGSFFFLLQLESRRCCGSIQSSEALLRAGHSPEISSFLPCWLLQKMRGALD